MSEREPPPAGEVERIGCLMLNGVGDILCCTPALEALKERYPRARMVAMVRPHLTGLVESNPAVDAVVTFGQGSLGIRLAFLRDPRRQRFDLWVDLHTPTYNTVTSNLRHYLRNALLMLWSGARFRRAYASAPLKPFLTHPLPMPTREELRELNVVQLTQKLAWPPAGRAYRKRFVVADADRQWAREALPGERRRIGLYFGTRQPANRWPEESARALLVKILAGQAGADVVLLGDATDTARARALLEAASEARARVRDFTGRATFGQTAAIMQRCSALVSSDSGPMHLADAVDVPMVAIFSTHNYPAVWRPVNGHAVAIYHEIACGPCFLAVCPIGNRCMANITPEEVYAALTERLSSSGSR